MIEIKRVIRATENKDGRAYKDKKGNHRTLVKVETMEGDWVMDWASEINEEWAEGDMLDVDIKWDDKGNWIVHPRAGSERPPTSSGNDAIQGRIDAIEERVRKLEVKLFSVSEPKEDQPPF